jgi:hypothetical protein
MAIDMDSQVKQVRIIWIAMLAAAVLYIWVPEQVHAQPKSLDSTFYAVFIVLVVVVLGMIVVFRKGTIDRVTPILQSSPNDLAALQKWRIGQIVTVAMSEAIVLYGLVLRFVGATRMQAAPFYLVGIGCMIVFWPKPVH